MQLADKGGLQSISKMFLEDGSPRSVTGIIQVITVTKHLRHKAGRNLCCALESPPGFMPWKRKTKRRLSPKFLLDTKRRWERAMRMYYYDKELVRLDCLACE